MSKISLSKKNKICVSDNPPFDFLQSFVRDNHIAIKGKAKGLLQGKTFAVKDVFKIKGSTLGNGHPDWLRYSEPDDFTSSAIIKLLDEGGDLVGKTICDELCFSISGENWHYGSPLNSHDARRLAGGSSSGSGAAAGAELVDFSLGSDCLGSVRVPASYNGVFGIRPTYNRIANDGEVPYCDSMDVLGYMAKKSEVFEDVSSILLGQDDREYSFKRLVIPSELHQILSFDIKSKMDKIAFELKNKFDEVIMVRLTRFSPEELLQIFQIVQGYEVWKNYKNFIVKYDPKLSPGPKERLKWSSKITNTEYRKSVEIKNKILKEVDSFLDDKTLILIPTASSIAPFRNATFDEIDSIRNASAKLLCLAPLAGIPQVTIPSLTIDNMPFGISFLSKQYSDLSLVKKSLDLHMFLNHRL